MLLSYIILAFVARTVCATSRCYFPDGSLDTLSFVCNTTAVDNGETSICCRAGDECYTSGTCFQGWSGITYRQSCTDSTWKSSTCPQTCLNSGQLGDGAWIQSCDLNVASACCVTSDSGSCCDNSTELFTYKPGILVAVLGNPSGLNRLVDDSSTTTSASTSSSSSTVISSGVSSSIAASTQSSSDQSSATSVPGQTSSASSQPNTAAIITGAVLGAAFALAFSGMLYFRKKFHSASQLAQASVVAPAAHNTYHHDPPGWDASEAPKAELMDHTRPAQLDTRETRRFAELQGSNFNYEQNSMMR